VWLNEWEIDELADRFDATSARGYACQYLRAYKTIVNENSDGWPYWRAGTSVAELLEEIASGRVAANDESIGRAVRRIRRFCTRRALPSPDIAWTSVGASSPVRPPYQRRHAEVAPTLFDLAGTREAYPA
jgi:hypothetical protein